MPTSADASPDAVNTSHLTPLVAQKTLLSWSSGKDSAWTLHVLRQRHDVELVGLFTTVNAQYERVAMHGVRQAVLEAQARAAGLPLHALALPDPCTNADYEAVMERFVAQCRDAGVTQMAFGDLYLEDVRRYREDRLRGTGITPIFPLWEQPTRELAEAMLGGGLEACLSCVDTQRLPADFSGRAFDHDLLAALPADVDPCGENGEFHTLVWDGPMFTQPLAVKRGVTHTHLNFVYTDFLPRDAAAFS